MADDKLDRNTAPPDVAESSASLRSDAAAVALPAPPDSAAQPTSDAFENAGDLSKVERPVSNKQTDDEKAMSLIALVEGGMNVREASSQVGVHIRTAYRVLARGDVEVDDVRATVRRLMVGEALERVDNWREAAAVGASKKGNHAPARDWLLHAGVIDELRSDSAQLRVAIHIGTDEHPLPIASPLTLASQCDEE